MLPSVMSDVDLCALVERELYHTGHEKVSMVSLNIRQ